MGTPRARGFGTLSVLLVLCLASGAWAGSPTDQLRDGFDRIVRILRDPALAGDTNATSRRTALVRAAHQIFDFGEMARRSLGPHWSQRTSAERGEFVRLFTELIQRSYLARVDQHSTENVVVRTERVDGALAVVQTTLRLANGRELPLDYRMHNVDGRWQVYDLSMDGISIVANYRTQFDNVIRSASYEALVARMKSRQAEVSAPPAAPSPRKTGR
jgi:phospholipid transport system substrate-binding protein